MLVLRKASAMLRKVVTTGICRATEGAFGLRAQHAATSATRYTSAVPEQDADDVFLRVKVAPIKREGEDIETKRARLVYQSRKRGILETDLLLSGFAAKHLKEMSSQQLDEYDELLDELDWDIYYWATRNFSSGPLPKKWENSVILQRLQEYSENKEKKILRMPDLSEF